MKLLVFLLLVLTSTYSLGQDTLRTTDVYPDVEAASCSEFPFPFGMDSLKDYLTTEMNFSHINEFDELRVYCRFNVMTDGTISNIRVENTDNKEIIKEIQRVFLRMPTWSPGLQSGKLTTQEVRIPLRITWANPSIQNPYTD